MTDATFTNLTVRRLTATTVEDLLTLDSVDSSPGNGAALCFINNSSTPGLHMALARVRASRVNPTTVRLDLAVVNDPTLSSGDDTLPLLSLVSEQPSLGVNRYNVLIASPLDVTGALNVRGNLDVTGTVDGRDVSGDGIKLDQHLANRANPHATTAAQVGALPTTGGTISGSLSVTDNVGIGTPSPKAKLDVAGRIKGGGVLAGIWAAQPTTDVLISVSGSWQAVADTSIQFSLDRAAIVFCTYSINVQPDQNPGGDWLGTSLAVDNTRGNASGSHYQPYTSGDSNGNLNGNLVLELKAGDHTVTLQWCKYGSTVASWRSSPSWALPGDSTSTSIGGRSLVVMAFYT
jgi:hypothetical protein